MEQLFKSQLNRLDFMRSFGTADDILTTTLLPLISFESTRINSNLHSTTQLQTQQLNCLRNFASRAWVYTDA